MPQIIYFGPSTQDSSWLSNGSPHPVHDGRGTTYRSAEHLYHACKAITPDDRALVAQAVTASTAYNLGRKVKLRDGWRDVRVQRMRQVLEAKFDQHLGLAAQLVDTGDALLRYRASLDPFWGCGMDGLGENVGGRLLMELRKRLQR